MKTRSFVGCLVGAAFMLSAQMAHAQQSTALTPAEVAAFQANPVQLLNQFPNGGPDMIKQIVGLLGGDKGTLSTIIGLAKTADQDQRKAMAAALAQVAKANAASDPGFANQIQQAVASSGLPEFAKAYAEAAGDTGTASTGGGGGGGGGPTVIGPPTGGQNAGIFGNPGGTPNNFTGLTTTTIGGGGFNNTNTTTNNQVSRF
jgi:hypothetical protein